MARLGALALPLLVIIPSLSWTQDLGAKSNRNHRLLNPISLIHFPNLECTSDDGTIGECYSASECAARGGTSTSSCASGFGVCCYSTITACGGTVTKNQTYLRNPGYTDSYSTSGTCSYKISKTDTESICFIRLDFDTMVLAGPTTGSANKVNGDCEVDQQTITEGVSRRGVFIAPQYCGVGTGQHMYINAFEGLDVQATIDITIGSASTEGRKWNIRVSQIECDNSGRPPSTECLQYHTGDTGTFQSWNYDGSTVHYTTEGQNYGICIRREEGFCGIQYVQADEPLSFTWGFRGSGDGGKGGVSGPTNANPTFTSGCDDNYVSIPGASASGNGGDSVDRWCGGTFGAVSQTAQAGNNAVTTYRKPFRVFIHRRDEGHNHDATRIRKGFKIDFRQLMCATK